MILLRSTNFCTFRSITPLIFCLALLLHGHLVTTDCLYLALLKLATPPSILLYICWPCFSSGRRWQLTFYLLFKWVYIFNRTAAKQNAHRFIRNGQVYIRTKNGCFMVRASRLAHLQTNWIHTNASHKHNQADCGKRILFAFLHGFSIWRISPKDVNIVDVYFISHFHLILVWVVPLCLWPWHGQCVSGISNAM